MNNKAKKKQNGQGTRKLRGGKGEEGENAEGKEIKEKNRIVPKDILSLISPCGRAVINTYIDTPRIFLGEDGMFNRWIELEYAI